MIVAIRRRDGLQLGTRLMLYRHRDTAPAQLRVGMTATGFEQDKVAARLHLCTPEDGEEASVPALIASALVASALIAPALIVSALIVSVLIRCALFMSALIM